MDTAKYPAVVAILAALCACAAQANAQTGPSGTILVNQELLYDCPDGCGPPAGYYNLWRGTPRGPFTLLPRLGQRESYGAYFPPAISPDGTKIAFATRGGHLAVAHLDLARGRTRGRARIVRGVTPPHAVVWSPNGTKLAFTQGRYNDRLSIVGSDGGGPRKLRCACPRVEADQGGFSWSTAGIAFGGSFLDSRPAGIFVVQPDGRGLRRITAAAGDGNDNQPVWSPDASRLVFVRNGERVHVVSATGGPVRLLARVGHAPAWSPDGRFVAYVGGMGQSSLHVKHLATGAARRVPLPHPLANYGGVSQLIWRR